MMISETVSHYSHIKRTGVGGWDSVVSFLWKTLAYLACMSASGGWNSLLQNRRGILKQNPEREVVQWTQWRSRK